jgi:CheY-like chemotaxis protein
VTDRLQTGHGVHRLILTDINMPEVDGMQMSKMIKRLLQKGKSKHEMQDAN